MPVNLSIKNVPEDLAAELRVRASRHHRSLQGELMVILEAAVSAHSRLSPGEVLKRVRDLGLTTGDDSAAIIRTDRDAR
jgi:plasmid stability protein